MREEWKDEKIALKKGNVSKVFSDGKVVYRDLKPQSKSVQLHEFLDSYGMRNATEVLRTLIQRLYIREITFIKENMADWI